MPGNTTVEPNVSMEEFFKRVYTLFRPDKAGYIVSEFVYALDYLKESTSGGFTLEQSIAILEDFVRNLVERKIGNPELSEYERESLASSYALVLESSIKVFCKIRGVDREKFRARLDPEGRPENPETPPN